jgi:hypothetical protein
MRLLSGRVIDGKIVVEGELLKEGSWVTVVTVVADLDEQAFSLTPEQEEELLEAIASVGRGEFVDGDEFLLTFGRRE